VLGVARSASALPQVRRPPIGERRARELGGSWRPSPDEGNDEAEPSYGDRLVVRLQDGRTVFLVYTGPRHFHAGRWCRMHVTDSAIFIL